MPKTKIKPRRASAAVATSSISTGEEAEAFVASHVPGALGTGLAQTLLVKELLRNPTGQLDADAVIDFKTNEVRIKVQNRTVAAFDLFTLIDEGISRYRACYKPGKDDWDVTIDQVDDANTAVERFRIRLTESMHRLDKCSQVLEERMLRELLREHRKQRKASNG